MLPAPPTGPADGPSKIQPSVGGGPPPAVLSAAYLASAAERAGSWAARRWGLWAAVGSYLFLTWTLALAYPFASEKEFVYALDDPYIHLAMARNFARDGVWGVTREGFAGANSSPLWVAALAACWKAGFDDVRTPLHLNLLGALVLLWTVQRAWLRERLPEGWSAAGLVLLVLAAPLPTLTLAGMEHIWHHVLVVLWWGGLGPLWRARSSDAAADAPSPRAWFWLLTALLPVLRLESVFLIAAAAALLLQPPRPKWTTAALLLAAGASLVVLFGWWSMRQGGTFLPNSIHLKGNAKAFDLFNWPDFARLQWIADHVPDKPTGPCTLLWIAALAVRAAFVDDPRRRRRLSEAGVLLLAAAAQLQFADVGWQFRYESYLIVLALLYGVPQTYECFSACAAAFRGDSPRRWSTTGAAAAAVLAGVVCTGALAARASQALSVTPWAMKNIYEQQVQTARFFAEGYPDSAVAVMDVGAVCYYNPDLRIVDVYGLATQEVADLRRKKAYIPEALDALARRRGVKAAATVSHWWGVLEGVPSTWVMVGSWKVAPHAAVFSPTIYFYAVDPAEAPRLVEELRRFAPSLPSGVAQGGPYTFPGTPEEALRPRRPPPPPPRLEPPPPPPP